MGLSSVASRAQRATNKGRVGPADYADFAPIGGRIVVFRARTEQSVLCLGTEGLKQSPLSFGYIRGS